MTLLELRALLPLLLVALTIVVTMLLAGFCRRRGVVFWVSPRAVTWPIS